MPPRSKFTYRGYEFENHGDSCPCELCDTWIRRRKSAITSVTLINSVGCWAQAVYPDKYPFTQEEAADIILDVHIPAAPAGARGIIRDRMEAWERSGRNQNAAS